MVKQDEAMRAAQEMANAFCKTPLVAQLREQVRVIIESGELPAEIPQIPAVREHFTPGVERAPNARQSRLGTKGGINSAATRSSKAEKAYRKDALRIAQMLCAVEGKYLSDLNLSSEIENEFPPEKRKFLRPTMLVPLIRRWRKEGLLPRRAKKPPSTVLRLVSAPRK